MLCSANPRRLKVLILDEEVPLPPNAGKRIRTWNLLRRLAVKHDLTLLCYGFPEQEQMKDLREAGIKVFIVPIPETRSTGWRLYLQLFLNLFSRYPFSVVKHYSSEFQRALDNRLSAQHWDLVVCEWTPYMRFLEGETHTPVLVTTHNVEAQIWQRRSLNSANPLARLFFRLQAAKMKRFERRALLRASAVTAVSQDDANVMRDWGVARVAVVPNGAEIPAAPFFEDTRDPAQQRHLLSISSLDWYPNEDALDFFVFKIFPEIRRRCPDVVFSIVGRRPSASLKQKVTGIPGVVLHGEVDNVRSFLAAATVVVVPLRIGGGSRLKILEALAEGKAVVSTSVGAEGLELIRGEHLLIADDPKDFAERVIELMECPEERDRLGASGRARVVEFYDWNRIALELEKVWLSTALEAEAIGPTEAPSAAVPVTRV